MSQNAQTTNQKNDKALSTALKAKANYVNRLQSALQSHNDLKVYKLLNTTKYYHLMKNKRYSEDYDYQALVSDLLPQLRHHLSHQLIKYLKRIYPFFYYREDHLGHYQVYFGDWWGHKLFGNLDVINVKFNFNQNEYDKLRQAFDDKHANIDSRNIKMVKKQNVHLTKLVNSQNKRDNLKSELESDLKTNESQAKMPWNSARIKRNYNLIMKKLNKLNRSNREAQNAKGRMINNKQKILEFSKENTVIDYEKQCVKKYFGKLSQFNESNKQLYYNYMSNLLAGGKN